MKKILMLLLAVLTLLGTRCGVMYREQFSIVSGSENKSLEPILKRFGDRHGIEIVIKYKGSVDIMLGLQQADFPYDAVWPANSLWINIGDKKRKVRHLRSIMTSPVVFGIRKSLAGKLGFVGKKVYVKDILEAVIAGKLKFLMTSATQSNSGASAYVGFLYALLGNPEVLSMQDLTKPELKTRIRQLFSGINRSSGSSGWLKELFVKGNYDAMVNYEAMIIEANKELVSQGKEPLYAVYPVDGIVMADSPFGWVKGEKKKKEETFLKIQQYLLSKEVQQEIVRHGRRVGFGGVVEGADKSVFNPDWGIDASRIISPIKLPAPEVIYKALHLYQTEFRKPSFTVFCLDYSGSMQGRGYRQLKEAMGMLLSSQEAKRYLINPSSEDITCVIPFNNKLLAEWKVEGNDPAKLQELLGRIRSLPPGGGTDIYSPAMKALQLLSSVDATRYIPAVILMTDGKSNVGRHFGDLESFWKGLDKDIPVFSILFGAASKEQLHRIAELTRGRIFDGRHNLIKAFRKAKGYN